VNGVDVAYGDRPVDRGSFYRFIDINFASITNELGRLGIRVEQQKQLTGVLEQALLAKIPIKVDVVTDPGQLFLDCGTQLDYSQS
jgi:thiamine pyrophosphate-dependent acetolactate synthase large subunit-like protein